MRAESLEELRGQDADHSAIVDMVEAAGVLLRSQISQHPERQPLPFLLVEGMRPTEGIELPGDEPNGVVPLSPTRNPAEQARVVLAALRPQRMLLVSVGRFAHLEAPADQDPDSAESRQQLEEMRQLAVVMVGQTQDGLHVIVAIPITETDDAHFVDFDHPIAILSADTSEIEQEQSGALGALMREMPRRTVH